MNFITKQAEKKLGIDLNGDGVVGSGQGRPGNTGGFSQGQGGFGGGLMNQVENATHMDLNGDGRVGGGAGHAQQYNQYGGAPGPQNYGQQGGPGYGTNPHQSGGFGGGLMNQFEKATHMDLNGDGHVGSGSGYPQNQNQYGHQY